MPSVNQFELYVFQYGLDENEEYKSEESSNQNENEWIYIKENYTYVDIDSFPGLTQIQKYELFISKFTSDFCCIVCIAHLSRVIMSVHCTLKTSNYFNI